MQNIVCVLFCTKNVINIRELFYHTAPPSLEGTCSSTLQNHLSECFYICLENIIRYCTSWHEQMSGISEYLEYQNIRAAEIRKKMVLKEAALDRGEELKHST